MEILLQMYLCEMVFYLLNIYLAFYNKTVKRHYDRTFHFQIKLRRQNLIQTPSQLSFSRKLMTDNYLSQSYICMCHSQQSLFQVILKLIIHIIQKKKKKNRMSLKQEIYDVPKRTFHIKTFNYIQLILDSTYTVCDTSHINIQARR